MTCHELFFVFGDLYVPGTQDAEVTKSLCVVPEISISTPLRLFEVGGWGRGALKGKFLRKARSSTGTSKGKEGLELKRPPWEVGELDIFWNNTWYEITNIINYFDLQSTLAHKIHYLNALII